MAKTMVCLFLLVLLASCSAFAGESATQQPDEPPAPEMADIGAAPSLCDIRDLPEMDGSTATLPLGRLVTGYFTGLSDDQLNLMVQFSGTVDSYYRLCREEVDLLLAYEADEAAIDERVEFIDDYRPDLHSLEYQPIGRDALVFLLSEQNPIQSLTLAEIQSIYRGEVTNWKEVGGENIAITPYQRNTDSGSQTLMRKLVLPAEELTAASPTTQVIEGMGELVDKLADYQNSAGAIGYSVYYYAHNMYATPGVKIIAVDGVVPSTESIAGGAYPLVNDFYAVVRGDEPMDSAAREMVRFLCSEKGQEIITAAGYPLPDNTLRQ